MTNNTKIKVAKGYVVVSLRGRIKADTVCNTKEEARFFLNQSDRKSKIVRCSIIVEFKQ